MARCVVVIEENNSNHARVGTPYIDPNSLHEYNPDGILMYEYLSEQLLNAIIEDCKSKGVEVLEIRNFFSDNTIKRLNSLEVNFEIQLGLYTLPLA